MKRFLSIVLIAAAVFAALNKLKRNKKTYTSGQKQLTKGEKSLAASEGKYYQAGGQLSSIKRQISEGESAVSELTQMINAISKVRAEYKTWKTSYDKIKKERAAVVKSLKETPDSEDRNVQRVILDDYVKFFKSDSEKYSEAIKKIKNKDQTAEGYKKYASGCSSFVSIVDDFETSMEELKVATKTIAGYTEEELYDALSSSQDTCDAAYWMLRMTFMYEDDPNGAKELVNDAKNDDPLALGWIIDYAKEKSTTESINDRINILKWIQLSINRPMTESAKNANANAEKLASSQDSIAKGIQDIFKAILNDSTMKKYAKKALGDQAVEILEMYARDPSPLSTSAASFQLFEKRMDSNPGLDKSLEKAQKYLTTQKTAATKKLSTAKTKYKNGLKTYNATPKKLETARKKLDNIKKKLAQFESSEKELEKGLNTLANTEANGDLKSIKDRLGGKVKFTDKKGHIDINKGFDAVDAGEAYLNEQGDLIKKEITGRIIATVMGVISAVLALLAALLSLFRSNRGAAIIACISAVMAAGAAALGSGTSSVYSELAGSHVGNAPWMAAAIIAGVAMVFSVTHFAAKVEDPLTEEE